MLHGQASLRPTSQSAAQTAPLVGEPLAKRKSFPVLITKKVFEQLGNIDEHYIHSLGDWDYSLSHNLIGEISMLRKIILPLKHLRNKIFALLNLVDEVAE